MFDTLRRFFHSLAKDVAAARIQNLEEKLHLHLSDQLFKVHATSFCLSESRKYICYNCRKTDRPGCSRTMCMDARYVCVLSKVNMPSTAQKLEFLSIVTQYGYELDMEEYRKECLMQVYRKLQEYRMHA